MRHLGGGTFDISILRITEGLFEVIATDGDNYLGGDDIDDEIIKYIAEKCRRKHGRDPREEPLARARIRDAAEKAKTELSERKTADIILPYLLKELSFEDTLTLRELEKMATPLVEQTARICERLLKDNQIDTSKIDHLVLVGGMTRMPLVQKAAEKVFGQKPRFDINPDEVVALGAAIQAAVLNGDRNDVLLLDVTPLSLGCGLRGDIFSRVIDRGTVIPTTGHGVYSTVFDNQTKITFPIFQGEREVASENHLLGTLAIDGIPAAPRGVPQIEVTFDFDENGILLASARDKSTGNTRSIRIENTGLLSEDEIEGMIREAEAKVRDDQERRRLAEDRNFLEDWIHDARKAADGAGPDRNGTILKNISEVQEVLASNDSDEIRRVRNIYYKASHN